ncbi:MAG: T9SS type A sorting domain-containing protein [Ignavibacteria bacterium]|nr:T9SS type A sorting domain-containing protein [Ignavibacteria bacterium]
MKKITLLFFFVLCNITFSQWSQSLNGISIWSLAKDNSGAIYAGSLTSTSAIYKTTNFGINWSTLASGNGQTIFSIAVDSAGRIFAANFSNGLMISTNGGVNFTTVPTSSFGGQNVQAVACGKNGYIYAGTNGGGLHRSTDFGVTWNPSTLTATQIITIAVDRFNPSIIYAGATSTTPGVNGFYKSTDHGATFSANTNPGINIYGIAQIDQLTLVTGSTSTGGPVHKSTNGGLNWVVAATGYVSRSAMIYYSSSLPVVYLAGNGGVFFSLNGGSNFTNAGLTHNSTPLTTHGIKIVTGVSGSSNGGAWIWTEPLSVEPTSGSIPESYSLSQNYPNPFNPSTKIHFQIPAVETTRLAKPTAWWVVSLRVYNALGSEVATLVNQQLAPGTYSATWNASNHPSGVYFYRLSAGEFTETNKMILIK